MRHDLVPAPDDVTCHTGRSHDIGDRPGLGFARTRAAQAPPRFTNGGLPLRKILSYLLPLLAIAGVVAGLTAALRPHQAVAADTRYWVDTFRSTEGYSEPGQGQPTGTLDAGTQYVFCKVRGPEVRDGDSFNTWWLATDLDHGSPWQNQYVSAFVLSRWGNDVAKDNQGQDIPTCDGAPASTPAQPTQPSPAPGNCASPRKDYFPGDSVSHTRYGQVSISVTACPGQDPSDWSVIAESHTNTSSNQVALDLSTEVSNSGSITINSRTFEVLIKARNCADVPIFGERCSTASEWKITLSLKRSGNDVTDDFYMTHPINNRLTPWSPVRLELFKSP